MLFHSCNNSGLGGKRRKMANYTKRSRSKNCSVFNFNFKFNFRSERSCSEYRTVYAYQVNVPDRESPQTSLEYGSIFQQFMRNSKSRPRYIDLAIEITKPSYKRNNAFSRRCSAACSALEVSSSHAHSTLAFGSCVVRTLRRNLSSAAYPLTNSAACVIPIMKQNYSASCKLPTVFAIMYFSC